MPFKAVEKKGVVGAGWSLCRESLVSSFPSFSNSLSTEMNDSDERDVIQGDVEQSLASVLDRRWIVQGDERIAV